MGAAAAAILIKERHIVSAFELARATSAERAMTPYDVGVDEVGVGWRRLRSRAVVREASPDSGRYYLDIEVWESLRRTRRRILMVIAVIVVVLLLTTLGSGLLQQ